MFVVARKKVQTRSNRGLFHVVYNIIHQASGLSPRAEPDFSVVVAVGVVNRLAQLVAQPVKPPKPAVFYTPQLAPSPLAPIRNRVPRIVVLLAVRRAAEPRTI